MTRRLRGIGLWAATASLVVLAACSGTAETSLAEDAEALGDSIATTVATTTIAPPKPPSTTSPAPVTTTSTSLEEAIDDAVAVLAAEFLAARATGIWTWL